MAIYITKRQYLKKNSYLRNKILISKMKNIKILHLVLFYCLTHLICSADSPINVSGKDAMSIGIYIEDLNSGNIILDYQSSKVYTPASVTKSLTAATALSTLSSDFRFETPVYISGKIHNNILFGDIIVYGIGDATLESMHFPENLGFCDSIANALKKNGIYQIEGSCRIKHKDFNIDCGINPNWELEDIAWGYGTGLYPFNYKDNVFKLNINSNVTTRPNIADLTIHKLPSNGSNSIDLMRPFNSNDLFIIGNLNHQKGYSNTCSMPFPQDVFIDELTAKLKESGIKLKQEIIENSDNFGNKLIYTHKSPPLNDILKSLMVRSDNLFAESILRVISTGKSLKNAINNELKIWEQRGLDISFVTIRDGSGLSRTNRLSPKFLAKILKWMYNSPFQKSYINLFPRAGVNGTLKSFLKGTTLEGKLAIKTGSMNGVQCYAGYKINDSEEPTHIIVIMVNNFFCKRSTLKAEIEKLLLKNL